MTVDRSKQAGTRKAAERRPDAAADGDPSVARALRTAYEQAVGEDVPAEFLDLLNKLS